jgi:hypothetical protein
MGASINPNAPPRGRVRPANKASWRVGALCFLGVLTCVPGARAEPAADRIVEVLEDVCISPATPEGMIEAGSKAAAAEGWKLLVDGPAPLPLMHNENGPKISFMSMWELPVPARGNANLAISIVCPEITGVRYSVCFIQAPADLPRGSLAQSLETKLGSLVTKDRSGRFRGSETWFLSEEKSRGDCGKQITLLHDERPSINNLRTLMFTDMTFPNDGNWNGPLAQTICRP